MIKKAIIVIATGISLFGLYHLLNQWLNVPDDNPVEQAIEEVIKDTTGLDIDLTPNSP